LSLNLTYILKIIIMKSYLVTSPTTSRVRAVVEAENVTSAKQTALELFRKEKGQVSREELTAQRIITLDTKL
jgi:hypothetical protein